MPGTDSFGQNINFALLSDAPDAQQLCSDLGNGLAQRSLMRFASASNRGATLIGASAPVEGMITYLFDSDRIEYYDGTAWQPLTPGAWTTFTPASGIVARSGSPASRIVNGSVEMRGTIQPNDGSAFPASTLITLGNVAVAFRPPAWRYFVAATEYAGALMYARVEVQPGGDLVAVFPAGSTAHWISLDQIAYSLTGA